MGKKKLTANDLSEDQLKKYESRLKELHLLDPKTFLEVTQIDVIQAVICLETREGSKTYGQIAIMLKTSPQNVQKRSKRCGCS